MNFTTDAVVALLDVISGGGPWWLQLHTGPPGPAGATNAAGPRAPIHFAAPTTVAPQSVTSDGTTTADGAAVNFGTWAGAVFPLADFVTHWTLWNAASGGTCWAKGPFGGIALRVAFVSGTVFTTPAAHAFAAGDLVELISMFGAGLPGPFVEDTIYTVTTAGLAADTFSLSSSGGAAGSAVAAVADAACIVQKLVPVQVNTADPVRVGNGEIVLFLE